MKLTFHHWPAGVRSAWLRIWRADMKNRRRFQRRARMRGLYADRKLDAKTRRRAERNLAAHRRATMRSHKGFGSSGIAREANHL